MRIRRMVEFRRVLVILVRRDLRVRYARSWLGYVWTLIDPLAMSLVYAFVFGVIYGVKANGNASINARTDGIDIVLFVVSGLLAWNWFNMCINETARALSAERLLVRSTNIPREMWVVRVVLSKGIEHLMSMPIYGAFILYFLLRGEVHVNWELVYIIPALVIQLILCIGMGLVMAPVTAMVDDFIRVVRIVLRMGFYLTPVVYSANYLGTKLPWAMHLQQLNPLTGIIDMYRCGITSHYTPDYHAWIFSILVSLAWLFFGMWVFRKLEPAILKEI
ncbi:ABC transporter permease [Leekyejoonella antrihumi]|nr:ABC transporter permease [Leekyejoonella antrihumi]